MSAQSMQALERANELRLNRSKIRRSLRTAPTFAAGRKRAAEVIADTPPCCATWEVLDFLCRVRWLTGRQVIPILRAAQVSPTRRLGGLTERERGALVEALTA